ncbi:MAG: c-type cytochrome, partial [Verrucomicrobiae bacterium]|nr:c-type cytochrome [Verrucomicrobiae bacterium]
ITLLGRLRESRDADIGRLLTLLSPKAPLKVQLAAANRLLELGALGRTLDRWSTLSPTVQAQLVTGCLSDRNQVAVLLTAIESGKLPLTAVDAASRARLTTYPQSQLRQQAKALFAGASNPDRAAVLERFSSATDLPGDIAKGRAQFATLCAACHQLEGVGRNLGADLTALADKSPGSLLVAILDPNRAVEDKFQLYQIDLKSGDSLAGMISAESGDSVTVQLLDGTTRAVLRGEIAQLSATGRSAMPEGLEAALDPQSLADLMAFVRQAKL